MRRPAVKRLAAVEVKAADRGEVTAVFSRFNVVDADGDWTYPDAFEDGAPVVISAYGHKSWEGALPVGRGVIRSDQQTARVEAQFFMTTQAARDTFEVVRGLGPLGQWSYSYRVLDADHMNVNGKRVRFLKRLEVQEVSPVLVGAGVGVTTQDAKDDLDPATRERLRAIAARLGPDREALAREYARFIRTGLILEAA